MKKSECSKYKVGDKVLWKTAPEEYKPSRQGGGRYFHGIGTIIEICPMGYVIVFHETDKRSYFIDIELEPVTKLHKALL